MSTLQLVLIAIWVMPAVWVLIAFAIMYFQKRRYFYHKSPHDSPRQRIEVFNCSPAVLVSHSAEDEYAAVHGGIFYETEVLDNKAQLYLN